MSAELAEALTCTQCGQPFTAPVCSPAHALLQKDPSAHAIVATLVEQSRRQALREVALELRDQAAVIFLGHGPHDTRAAALWDAASHIDPDDKNALGGAR